MNGRLNLVGDHLDGDDASLDSIPQTELLDVSASRSRAYLASSGALGQRRPPSKTNSVVSVRCVCGGGGGGAHVASSEARTVHF